MSAVQEQRPNPTLRAAFPILVVFLLSVFTGILEWTGFLASVHLLLILAVLGLSAIFITGRFKQVVMTPVGKILTLFTLWFILCIPFAIWRGGSFGIFVNEWSKSYLAYILTAGLILTIGQLRTAFRTIAYSIGFLGALALAAHQYDATGRLGLIGSRYGNANEFGFTLLVGLIFLGYVYLRSGGLRKALAVLLMIPVLIALAKTGSRGSLLGALVLFIFLLTQTTAMARARLVIAMPILMMALILVVPSQLRDRYVTLFKGHGDEALTSTQEEASGSSEERLQLLKDSITTTFSHPFFGVGPGNFMVEQANMAVARGEPYGLWRVTHNSYTQLSSETGLPGLVIYLVFLFQCWKTLAVILRRKHVSKDVRVMAQTLRAALLVLVTVAFTDSVAYGANIPIMAGLITALSFIARSQRVADKRQSKPEDSTPLPTEPEYEPALTNPLYN